MYKGTLIRFSVAFSAETLLARKKWNDISKILNYQPRILYPVKLSFRYDRETKAFQDNRKLRELSTTRLALQEMIKEALLPETQRQRFTKL